MTASRSTAARSCLPGTLTSRRRVARLEGIHRAATSPGRCRARVRSGPCGPRRQTASAVRRIRGMRRSAACWCEGRGHECERAGSDTDPLHEGFLATAPRGSECSTPRRRGRRRCPWRRGGHPSSRRSDAARSTDAVSWSPADPLRGRRSTLPGGRPCAPGARRDTRCARGILPSRRSRRRFRSTIRARDLPAARAAR